ncbi:MAG TPA: hypothetical protein DCM05_00075 [Elusimicrobia bacterium]|nr:hypothetical protein [Elusimicrobiota bacterium]
MSLNGGLIALVFAVLLALFSALAWDGVGPASSPTAPGIAHAKPGPAALKTKKPAAKKAGTAKNAPTKKKPAAKKAGTAKNAPTKGKTVLVLKPAEETEKRGEQLRERGEALGGGKGEALKEDAKRSKALRAEDGKRKEPVKKRAAGTRPKTKSKPGASATQ